MGNLMFSILPVSGKGMLALYRSLQHRFSTGLLFACLLSLSAPAQTPADNSLADKYAKKYPEEGVICVSARKTFSFDIGKNELGDQVVQVTEEAEYEFLSLKRFASLMYPEFYNKFIQLKSFKRAARKGNKFVTYEKGGIDRAVADNDIFFDDSRVQFFPLRFSDKGVVQKITVKKLYSDGRYLTRLFFHEPYPVIEQIISFKVPEWLKMDFKKMNFAGFRIETSDKVSRGITQYDFVVKETPAYKSEVKRIGRAYTDPHLIVQLRSFENKGETIRLFENVDDVYRWNNRLYNMAGNDKQALKALLEGIVKGKTSDTARIKAIYYWVQDHIRYIAYEDGLSGYIPASVQDVMAKKYGDCKGMANLLTELLRMAGFDARFSWIGTRHLPYPQTLPALCVNNHAISTLVYGGKTYYLDGTEKFAPFGENAFRIQGKEVLIANGDKSEIKTVPATTAAENRLYTKAELTLAGEKLTGKVKVELSGNQRTEFHQAYQELPAGSTGEFLNDYVEFGNNNMVATQVKTSDLKNREIPVTIEGEVDLSNTVSSISGDRYVSIDFFPKSLERFIPDEKRIEGYDLDIVVKFEDEISLTLPAGFQFTDKPENLDISGAGYSFKGIYLVEGSRLTLKKELNISNSIIRKTEFTEWKKFVEAIREFNRYLVTISKK
ncbi:MAG TPA: transglutaminase domain-containing protein [Chitinophagaceae bacterium]|nr:transglutaminase domain-containing protein [Chitinophagaceae bacterium]